MSNYNSISATPPVSDEALFDGKVREMASFSVIGRRETIAGQRANVLQGINVLVPQILKQLHDLDEPVRVSRQALSTVTMRAEGDGLMIACTSALSGDTTIYCFAEDLDRTEEERAKVDVMYRFAAIRNPQSENPELFTEEIVQIGRANAVLEIAAHAF